jgi:hypothetical protein
MRESTTFASRARARVPRSPVQTQSNDHIWQNLEEQQDKEQLYEFHQGRGLLPDVRNAVKTDCVKCSKDFVGRKSRGKILGRARSVIVSVVRGRYEERA